MGVEATQFYPIAAGRSISVTTVADRETIMRSPGTLSNLAVKVITNTKGTATLCKSFKAADGNQVVSFGASETGTKEDTTNTDTVTAGDNWSIKIEGGSGFAVIIPRIIFDADTDTVMVYDVTNQGSMSSASATRFYGVGAHAGGPEILESETQSVVRNAGTLKNMRIRIDSNARTTNTIYELRTNGVNSGITVTFGSTETGIKEDTTNTKTVSSGDLLSYRVTTGSGSGSISPQGMKFEYVTTNGKFQAIGEAFDNGTNISTSQTENFPIYGRQTTGISESDIKMTMGVDLTWSDLNVTLNSNGITANTTIKSRINGANGNQSVTFASGESGTKTDSSNTDSIVASDEINYQMITGGTGTTLTHNSVTSVFEAPSAAVTFIPKVIMIT